MTNAEQLYAAFWPVNFRLLGQALRPYSLGSEILLHRVESGLVSSEYDLPGWEDLAVAAVICSNTFSGALEAMADPRTPTLLGKLAKHLVSRPTWRHWIGHLLPWRMARRLGGLAPEFPSLPVTVAAFATYRNAGWSVPYFRTISGPGKPANSGIPPLQMLRMELLRETNLTDDQILDRPLALTIYDWVSIAARSGKVQIIDRKAFEDAESAGEWAAQMIAEGKLN